MNKKLFFEAITKYLLGLLLVSILLFIPEGSIKYIHGWLFIGLLFIPMFIAGIIMLFKNPELLKNRLNAKEKQKDSNNRPNYKYYSYIRGNYFRNYESTSI